MKLTSSLHQPVDHVLFDRLRIPIEWRGRIPTDAATRTALAVYYDESARLPCGNVHQPDLAIEVWNTDNTLTFVIKCRKHPFHEHATQVRINPCHASSPSSNTPI